MTKLQTNTTQSLLNSDGFKSQLKLALPKHLTPERMLRISMTELRKNPKLASCDPNSFLGAIIQCSTLGLEPGSGLGQAYLIPYGKEVTMQIGFQGKIDIAMRSGKIDSIIADCVYQDDDFDFFTNGMGQHIEHRPNWKSERLEKDIKIVYAIAKVKDGGSVIAYMTRNEIDNHRKKFSKGGNIWRDHFAEMAKKTVINRLYKYLPKSIEMKESIKIDNKPEPTDFYQPQTIDTPQIETKPVGKSAEDMQRLNDELDQLGKNVEAAEANLKK